MLLMNSWQPPAAPTLHPVAPNCPPSHGPSSLPRVLFWEPKGASAPVLDSQFLWRQGLWPPVHCLPSQLLTHSPQPPHLPQGFVTRYIQRPPRRRNSTPKAATASRERPAFPFLCLRFIFSPRPLLIWLKLLESEPAHNSPFLFHLTLSHMPFPF